MNWLREDDDRVRRAPVRHRAGDSQGRASVQEMERWRRQGNARPAAGHTEPVADPRYSPLKCLRELVADDIREAILDGALRPGQKIHDAEVADHMGVSRTALRDALRQLEREGLVRSLPSRGMVVSYLSREDLIQLYGIRSVLDGLAAAWACGRIDESEMEELHRLCYEMQNLLPVNTEEERVKLLRKDVQFHDLMVAAARSPRLADAVGAIRLQIRMVMAAGTLSGPFSAQASSEHQMVVDAVTRGDAVAAERLARIHVERSRDRVLQVLPNHHE